MALAFLLAPDEVGSYALAIAVVTFFQTVADVSLRQHYAMRGDAYGLTMPRNVRAASILSFAAVFAYVVLSSAGDVEAFLVLSPLALVPLASSWSVVPLTRLQRSGQFSTIARCQVLATVASTIVGLAVLLAHRSVLGACVQFFLGEAFLSGLLLWRRTEQRPIGSGQDLPGPGPAKRELGYLALINGLGWSQSQLDRIVVAALAGSQTVGLYSLASASTRAVPELLSLGVLNVYRPVFTSHYENRAHDDARAAMTACARVLAQYGLLLGVLYLLLVPVTLLSLLNSAWNDAIVVMPMMLLGGHLAGASGLLTMALQTVGRSRRVIPAQVVGILIVVLLVGPASLHGIRWLAAAAVVRDLAVLLIRYRSARDLVPASALRVWLYWTLPLALVCSVTYFALTSTVN